MKKSILILLIFLAAGLIFCTGSNPMMNLPSAPMVAGVNATSGVNIKIQFVNNSGIVASRIHVVIRGLDKSKNPGYFNLEKDPIEWVRTSSYNNMPSNVPDVTLDKILAKNNGIITVPYSDSGRVYLAIDKRIYDESQLPAWVKRNQAKDVCFDKFELAVVDWGEGPNMNLTQVDFFNIPLKIETGGQVRGIQDGITRKQIFQDYLAASSGDWSKLVFTSGGKYMRILNPGKIVPDDPDFPNLRKYFADIIKTYWTKGTTFKVIRDDNQNVVVCTSDGSKITAPGFGSYTKPSSVDIFGQAVPTGNDPMLVKWISCAINRGVIYYQDTNQNSDTAIKYQGVAAKFYAPSLIYNKGVYNYYSEFFHRPQYVYGNRAYALAFDDVFGTDSKLDIPSGSTITVTLQPFGGE